MVRQLHIHMFPNIIKKLVSDLSNSQRIRWPTSLLMEAVVSVSVAVRASARCSQSQRHRSLEPEAARAKASNSQNHNTKNDIDSFERKTIKPVPMSQSRSRPKDINTEFFLFPLITSTSSQRRLPVFSKIYISEFFLPCSITFFKECKTRFLGASEKPISKQQYYFSSQECTCDYISECDYG